MSDTFTFEEQTNEFDWKEIAKGDPAIIYELEPSVYAMVYDPDSESMTPSTLRVFAYTVIGGTRIPITDGWMMYFETFNASGTLIDSYSVEFSYLGVYTLPSGIGAGCKVQVSIGEIDALDVSYSISLPVICNGKDGDPGEVTEEELDEVKNTLSHKADLIYDTASGDIASFPDGADGLQVKDLTVAIEPVQSGTGDPSPTNVRPISGWTGCDVYNSDIPEFYNSAGTVPLGNNVLTILSKHSLTISGTNLTYISSKDLLSNYNLTLGNTYTIRAKIANKSDSALPRVAIRNEGGGIRVGSNVIENGYIQFSFTYESDMSYLSFFANFSTKSSDFVTYSEITFAEGNKGASITEYPTITFHDSQGNPLTVYGGTLDVTSGVLTVDRAMVTIDGTYTPSKNGGILCFYNTSSIFPGLLYPSDNNTKVDFYCNIYEVATANAVKNKDCRISVQGSSNHRTDINDTMYNDDVNGWKAARAVTPLVVVYKLATPLVIQLDPVTVNTLLGQNDIWADCGPSTVEYPADTKLYIQKINTPTDDDMIADANIASGKYFIVNNNLYLSTAAILAGDPIKPGTNCTLTNLAAALNALNS